MSSRRRAPEAAIPVVYCDWPAQVEDSIVFDAPGAAAALAEHLAEHGHRRVAFMTPTLEFANMAALIAASSKPWQRLDRGC